jgi:hypothetical protein
MVQAQARRVACRQDKEVNYEKPNVKAKGFLCCMLIAIFIKKRTMTTSAALSCLHWTHLSLMVLA